MAPESSSFVLIASLHALALCAYATPRIALYAATLCALTFLPRKARREPTLVIVFEASLFAYAFDTPPFAFAL